MVLFTIKIIFISFGIRQSGQLMINLVLCCVIYGVTLANSFDCYMSCVG